MGKTKIHLAPNLEQRQQMATIREHAKLYDHRVREYADGPFWRVAVITGPWPNLTMRTYYRLCGLGQ